MTDASEAQGATINPAVPIVPQLHIILRDRIIRNDLRPEERLSEAEVAQRYGVSRQPVREAFIRLALEGLITIRPQRSTSVARIALASVHDARFLREAIEADIVRLLAEDPDPATVAELRALIDRQRALGPGDAPAFIAADDAFHRALASGAGKAGIWSRVQGLKAQMDRVRFLSFGQLPAPKLVAQHALIVEAIAAGDPDGAERAARLHLRAILHDLPHIVAAHPQFFDLPEGTDPGRTTRLRT
ncbi:GntR family transcriptional regulator [uncultured Jannaschia sp.]|uniref:GntR family transcriptional regulator n=1 Tax=uncultured Jannaschia sp. TaxID=293347 RepID=UPI00263645E0|nr:GntR family transcriptional regulator [uncultured Jannaschia sp.]